MIRYALKHRKWIFALSAILVLITTITVPRPQTALAHPLGNFTINRYSRIEPGADRIDLLYVLDMAEIPTFQEMSKIDLDKDGIVSDEEHARYLKDKVSEIRGNINLKINNSSAKVDLVESELTFPPGQGNLPTLRLTLNMQAQYRQFGRLRNSQIYYEDKNYDRRLGWREIIARPGAGVSLIESSVPENDRSNELRKYPKNLLSNPPRQREARLTFAVDSGISQVRESQPASVSEPSGAKSGDLLTSLITVEQLSLPVIILSLFVALGLGALHALSPGHGKTIMAAYLVGSSGTAKHAMFLGITVTISHTLGVLALGLVILFASSFISPEQLYPWLGIVSGIVIIGFGIWLLVMRFSGSQSHHHHDEEGHSHDHDGAHVHEESSRLARIYGRAVKIGERLFHGHSHDDDHSHQNSQPSQQSSGGLRITWKSLTALGVVGGLVPSVSALVILLAAISLQRIGFGLVLILAFSAGMAFVLAGIGLLLVYTKRAMERFQFRGKATLMLAQAFPVLTALFVLASGVLVATRAAFQMGLL